MGLEQVLAFILDNLKQALHLALENLGRQILAWFEHIFPLHNISTHWIHVALFYLTAAVVCSAAFCLCQCCGGARGRMMKAPGSNSRMRRSAFEDNPKGYFKGLRSRPHRS